MARECEYARLELERIGEMYPGKRVLNITEVSKYVGRERHWVARHYSFNKGYISTIKLANELQKV